MLQQWPGVWPANERVPRSPLPNRLIRHPRPGTSPVSLSAPEGRARSDGPRRPGQGGAFVGGSEVAGHLLPHRVGGLRRDWSWSGGLLGPRRKCPERLPASPSGLSRPLRADLDFVLSVGERQGLTSRFVLDFRTSVDGHFVTAADVDDNAQTESMIGLHKAGVSATRGPGAGSTTWGCRLRPRRLVQRETAALLDQLPDTHRARE